MMKHYLVFDWGGTFLKYAVMNEETEILHKDKIPAPSGDSTKEEFYRLLDPIVEQYRNEIAGIAVSMPGMLDDSTGYCRTGGSLRFNAGTNVAKEMFERWQLPVSVENDGKAAVLAEHWKGALQGCHDCAVLIIGTGIGGGIILNDRLLVGKDFSAGEYSYICTNDQHTDTFDGFWCRNGHKVIGRKLSAATGEPEESLDGIELFKRIRNNDETAKQVLREIAADYAVQIYNLSILLNLEKIAVGGGISADPLLIDYLKKALWDMHERLPFGPMENSALIMADVVPCQFRNDANLIGALYHHLYGTWEN